MLQSAHQKTLKELAQCEQFLKEESERHKQQIISMEKEHQEKVLTYLILESDRISFCFPSSHPYTLISYIQHRYSTAICFNYWFLLMDCSEWCA
jgi:hypothetical protein